MERKIIILSDVDGLQNDLYRFLHMEVEFLVRYVDSKSDYESEIMAFNPDVIFIDYELIGVDGLVLCKQVRPITDSFIVCLSERANLNLEIKSIECGADYFFEKPFSYVKVLTYVRSMIRRSSNQIREVKFGDIRIDFPRCEVRRNGEKINLTPKEFCLLRYLVNNRDDIVTRAELLRNVWGLTSQTPTRTIDQFIAKLRRKLGDNSKRPKYIVTVHGYGYRFCG